LTATKVGTSRCPGNNTPGQEKVGRKKQKTASRLETHKDPNTENAIAKKSRRKGERKLKATKVERRGRMGRNKSRHSKG